MIIAVAGAKRSTAAVLIHLSEQPSVIPPEGFGDATGLIVKMFAAAHVALAHIKSRRRLDEDALAIFRTSLIALFVSLVP